MKEYSDTERLNFLMQYFEIADVGDEEVCIGVIVRNERLEEEITKFAYPIEWNEDFRTILDRAIFSKRKLVIKTESPAQGQ